MQVAVPALSHFGIQVCPLPTALLSTHTGGFTDYTFLDLTDEMNKIAAHWRSLGIKFDAVYSGFLGNAAQIDTVASLPGDFAAPGALTLVDPVMGDNGSIYRTYTAEMCAGMHRLCEHADIITPNLTEAYLLTGIEYDPSPSDAAAEALLEKLARVCTHGNKAILLHGIHRGDLIYTYYYDSLTASGASGRTASPYCDKFYPGCGDLFASLLLGMLLRGECVADAAAKASRFISDASFYTRSLGTPSEEGVAFEELLEGFDR